MNKYINALVYNNRLLAQEYCFLRQYIKNDKTCFSSQFRYMDNKEQVIMSIIYIVYINININIC